MGGLLLKKWRKSAIFCAFLRATGVLVFLLSRCMCGGGWGVTGVFGIVDVMDRGYAIKFSYGRAVVSVVVRFYRGGFAVNIL